MASELLAPVSVVYLRGPVNRWRLLTHPILIFFIDFVCLFVFGVIVDLICCAVFNNHLIFFLYVHYFMPLIVLYSVRGQDHWLS